MERYDKIIIGAGIYGLYAALFCGRKKENVLVLEHDSAPFKRATYINQARVHNGYHYPRSLSTAKKSAAYFERFSREYEFCINRKFDQIYAISNCFSWSDAEQFQKFCKATEIFCEEMNPDKFFKKGMCEAAFLTEEYTYDAMILKNYYMEELEKCPSVKIKYNVLIESIYRENDSFIIQDKDEKRYQTGFVLNAAYAGANQILEMAGFDKFEIKYELCEIILCNVNEQMQRYGFTVMDGPFFSIMPFGKTGLHSLTSVTFTPHATSFGHFPRFDCQEKLTKNTGGGCKCSKKVLGNCNECAVKPETAFPYMEQLSRKYLKDEYRFTYKESLFSMKPILVSSEIDDSRPTVSRIYSENPTFIGVLSGKINTVYDLDEVLTYGE